MRVIPTIPWLPVLRLHSRWLFFVFLSGGLAVWLQQATHHGLPNLQLPFSIVGVALSIFLAFRNNASYDRWWEGRKLWGGIINGTRSLARQIVSFTRTTKPEEEEKVALFRREMVHRTIAWTHALRGALRGDEDVEASIAELLAPSEREELEKHRNVPAAIAKSLGVRAVDAADDGWLTEHRLARIDASISDLVALHGGCERIVKTPLPVAYGFFTTRFVRAYCCALPFGLVESVGGYTIGVCVLLALVFLVLDAIGRLIEVPFSPTPNGLPLRTMCVTIEINLRQCLDETEIPPDPQPKGGVLL